MNKKIYRKGVFVVVYKFSNNKLKYLIMKRKLHWKGFEFVKGGKEKGESNLDCAKRELYEETNLNPIKIINHKINGKYLYDEKTKKDRKRINYIGQTFTLFSAKVNSGRVIIDKNEHSKYYWLNYDLALKKLKWANQKRCLKIVNNAVSKSL